MTEIAKNGWEILNNPMAKNTDKALAMREIREATTASFDKMFEAGVFEKKLGTFDLAIRDTPLPEERKQAIRATIEGPPLGPVFEVTVANVDQATERLAALGCTVVNDEPNVPRRYMRDPYGLTQRPSDRLEAALGPVEGGPPPRSAREGN